MPCGVSPGPSDGKSVVSDYDDFNVPVAQEKEKEKKAILSVRLQKLGVIPRC
jgi:hypothetical protein